MASSYPRLGLASLALVFATAGCFSYVAHEPEGIDDGEEVRVVLHPAGIQRMAETHGWNQSLLIGRLTRVTQDSVSVSVRVSRQAPGTAFSQARQVVTVGRDEVIQVEQPELNRNRTALFGAGSAVAGGLLLARMLEGDAGSGAEGIDFSGSSPTDPSIIPIWFFR